MRAHAGFHTDSFFRKISGIPEGRLVASSIRSASSAGFVRPIASAGPVAMSVECRGRFKKLVDSTRSESKVSGNKQGFLRIVCCFEPLRAAQLRVSGVLFNVPISVSLVHSCAGHTSPAAPFIDSVHSLHLYISTPLNDILFQPVFAV